MYLLLFARVVTEQSWPICKLVANHAKVSIGREMDREVARGTFFLELTREGADESSVVPPSWAAVQRLPTGPLGDSAWTTVSSTTGASGSAVWRPCPEKSCFRQACNKRHCVP